MLSRVACTAETEQFSTAAASTNCWAHRLQRQPALAPAGGGDDALLNLHERSISPKASGECQTRERRSTTTQNVTARSQFFVLTSTWIAPLFCWRALDSSSFSISVNRPETVGVKSISSPNGNCFPCTAPISLPIRP